MPAFPWLVIGLAVFLIGVTKSGFGGGLGLLNVPLIVLAMGYTPLGSKAGPGFMLPLLILGDVLAVVQHRKHLAPRLLLLLLPGSILGILLGYGLLTLFHRPEHTQLLELLIRTEIGCECLLLVGLHWLRSRSTEKKTLLREPLRSGVTGTFAGVSSTLANAAGPIIAMYLLPLNLDRRKFVGTSAVYFFVVNCLKLPAFVAAGMFASASPAFALKFAPLVLVGAVIGWLVLRKLSDKRFSQIMYAATFVLGLWLAIDGAVRLMRLHHG